jgi:large subunit ribosomal protein L18
MKTIKRRRIENKTDYAKRIKLLTGGYPRIVFRKTNRYIIAQYVISIEAQDSIVFSINSKKLLKYDWPKELEGSLKSIPAAYLLGLLFGKKIIREKLKKPIVDFGMHRALHKTKPFAFLKGLIDSGVKIECPVENFPEEERIKGKNLVENFSKFFEIIKSKIEKE